MYDSLACEINCQNKIIKFDMPLFNMAYLDDCAYAAMNSILAFNRQAPIPVPQSDSFSLGKSDAKSVNELLIAANFKPILESIFGDTIFEILRSYGPFLAPLSATALQKYGLKVPDLSTGHACVVCGVGNFEVSIIYPGIDERTYRKNLPIINKLHDIDLQEPASTYSSKIIHLPISLLIESIHQYKGAIAPCYLPSAYTNQITPRLFELEQSFKSTVEQYSKSLSSFLAPTPQVKTEPVKVYLYMTLSKKALEQEELLTTVTNFLSSDKFLIKFSTTPITEFNIDILQFLLKEDAFSGVLEAEVIDPTFIKAPYIWRPGNLDKIKPLAFFPLDELKKRGRAGYSEDCQIKLVPEPRSECLSIF